ncbi:MAG TPA: TIGR02449 family protein [Gammaproteobacteria bacterium]|nr:TIGR02449 family protein [Gammaproteobacteria bacterium]
METQQDLTYSEGEWSGLENRIESLIETCLRLREENQLLRDQFAQLTEEKARLARKTDQACVQVERMLLRLKSLEAES